jgi:endogenous inhibitor of DNA gyrase (YacG/DUF329 family)
MAKVITLRPEKQNECCPICEKPEISNFNPFCSKRCADLDLGKWLKGDYRIPTNEEADIDGELPETEY